MTSNIEDSRCNLPFLNEFYGKIKTKESFRNGRENIVDALKTLETMVGIKY